MLIGWDWLEWAPGEQLRWLVLSPLPPLDTYIYPYGIKYNPSPFPSASPKSLLIVYGMAGTTRRGRRRRKKRLYKLRLRMSCVFLFDCNFAAGSA